MLWCTLSAMTAYGDELRFLRESAGVSLRALASHLKWTPTYLSDVERGRRKPFDLRTTKKILERIKGQLQDDRGQQEKLAHLLDLSVLDRIQAMFPPLSEAGARKIAEILREAGVDLDRVL